MADLFNAGKVNIEAAERSIVENGGGKTVQQKDGYEHHVAYSRDENRHLSYDKYPDGTIKNVHTDKDNKSYMDYGN